MKLHPLNPNIPCPSCGQPSLVYVRTTQGRDIYRCAVKKAAVSARLSTHIGVAAAAALCLSPTVLRSGPGCRVGQLLRAEPGDMLTIVHVVFTPLVLGSGSGGIGTANLAALE